MIAAGHAGGFKRAVQRRRQPEGDQKQGGKLAQTGHGGDSSPSAVMLSSEGIERERLHRAGTSARAAAQCPPGWDGGGEVASGTEHGNMKR